jgi:hypothetical protein
VSSAFIYLLCRKISKDASRSVVFKVDPSIGLEAQVCKSGEMLVEKKIKMQEKESANGLKAAKVRGVAPFYVVWADRASLCFLRLRIFYSLLPASPPFRLAYGRGQRDQEKKR